jgi:hypothetical protein
MRGEGLYCIVRHDILGRVEMGIESKSDEIRWQVLKAMLDEFPRLKKKAQNYLKEQDRKPR